MNIEQGMPNRRSRFADTTNPTNPTNSTNSTRSFELCAMRFALTPMPRAPCPMPFHMPHALFIAGWESKMPFIGGHYWLLRTNDRYCFYQFAGIILLGRIDDIACQPLLYDPPRLHYGDPVGYMADHTQIVGDK